MRSFGIIVLIFLFIIISCSKEEVENISVQYVDYNFINTNEKINHKSRKYKAIDYIKQSSFTTYTNLTIGDLISAFDKVEWDDFIAEDDYMRYIDLVGTTSDSNKYFCQFQIIDAYHWELYAFEINDTPYTVDDVANRLYLLYKAKKENTK